MTNASYKETSPKLGIFPSSKIGKIFFFWAAFNITLAIAPLFFGIGNNKEMFLGILPITILYSYLVFISNCILGLFFYIYRARPWANNQ